MAWESVEPYLPYVISILSSLIVLWLSRILARREILISKKACYNNSSALTTSRFIGIATADSIGFSHPVKYYCVLSLSGTSNGLLLCQTDHIMWHIFLDAATRAFFLGIPLSTSLL